MSNATATLGAGMVPAKWRVLNALFYAGSGGINLATLVTSQDINWDQMNELDSGSLVVASMGSIPVEIADLAGTKGSIRATATRVRLTSVGHRRVTTNPANQVITCLGGQPNQRARVRDCKAEGMADDDLLRRMESCHLINVTADGVPMPLAAFRRIPPQLLVHLSAKGRRYFPNGYGR